MCNNCGSYLPCNCNYTLANNCDPCQTNIYCDEKIDANCVFYNLNGGINNLIKTNLPNGSNLKLILDTIDSLLGGGGGTPFTDQLVKISSTDTTAGYLINKLVAGSNITIIQQNIGANESLQVNALNNKVAVDNVGSPDFLINQVIGGTDGIINNTILDTVGKLQVQPSIDIAALLTTILGNSTYLNLMCQIAATCSPSGCTVPSNLSVSFTNVSSITSAILTWVAGGGGGTQAVQYKLNLDSSYTVAENVSPTTTTNTIINLISNRLYNFRITNNCSGGLPTSTQINGAYISCPTITITPSTNFITVSFPNLGGDITSYIVNLYAADGTTLLGSTNIGSPFNSTITTTFNNLNPATTYNVQVISSINNISNSTCAKQSTTTSNPAACLAPTNVVLTPSASGSIEASWTPQSGILNQEIYYSPASGVTGVPPNNGWVAYSGNPVNPSQSNVLFTGLSPQLFSFAIRSNCQYGNSAFAQASVNYVPQSARITNDLPNIQVTNITGITGFTFVGPVGVGGLASGSHSSFTGIIGVTLTGNALFAGNITLSKGGTILQTINLPIGSIGTTYYFNSFTFSTYDEIDVAVNI